MSPKEAGGSRQGESGGQLKGEKLPVTGDMSQLLGNAGERIARVLREADEATRRIFEQARQDARDHNKKALEEADRLTRERIEKMTRITEQVAAQSSTLQLRARELTAVIRRSADTLSDELGVEPDPAGGAVNDRRAMEPDSLASGSDSDDAANKPPTALRELFGFKRKRFTDNPPSSDAARVRALQMIVAGYGEKVER